VAAGLSSEAQSQQQHRREHSISALRLARYFGTTRKIGMNQFAREHQRLLSFSELIDSTLTPRPLSR
jgi:hypothetical protein